jgi:hypothetical protein
MYVLPGLFGEVGLGREVGDLRIDPRDHRPEIVKCSLHIAQIDLQPSNPWFQSWIVMASARSFNWYVQRRYSTCAS